MSSKNIEKKLKDISEDKEKLNSKNKNLEENVQNILLQEHPPEKDYDISKADIVELNTLSDKEIDRVLADGFQDEDLDKIFASPDKSTSTRYKSRVEFLKDNLSKSLKDCPDLKKSRELIKQSLAKKTTDWLKEQNRQIDEKYEQAKKSSDSPAKTIAITGLKLIPFAGPISDISEGVVGKDMYGQKLTTKEQAYKILEGGIFLALDATGYGLIATKGVTASKLITRSAALMRKLKVSPRLYKPLYKTGVFIKKNKELARLADVMLDTVKTNKEARKAKDLEDLKPLLGITESDQEAIDIAREIPEFRAHIDNFHQKHNLSEGQLKNKEHKTKAKDLLQNIESGEIG
jgi:hypothetical protein